MYYQTQAVSQDKAWTSCTIVEATPDKYIVEYTEDGEFKTQEIEPEELQNLDYSDISQ